MTTSLKAMTVKIRRMSDFWPKGGNSTLYVVDELTHDLLDIAVLI